MEIQVPFFSSAILCINGLTPIALSCKSLEATINQGQACSVTLTKSTRNIRKGFHEHLAPILQRATRCASDNDTITYYFDNPEPLKTPDEASQESDVNIPFFSKATMVIEGGTETEIHGSSGLLTAINQGQYCSLTLIKSDIEHRRAFRSYLMPIIEKRANRCTSTQETIIYYFNEKKENVNNTGPGEMSQSGGNMAGRWGGDGVVNQQPPPGGPLPSPPSATTNNGVSDVLDTLSEEKVMESTKVCEYPGCSRAFLSADSHHNCTLHSECVQAIPGTDQAIFCPHDCPDCSDMLDILNEGDCGSMLLDVARYLLVGRLKMARQVFSEVLSGLTPQFGEWMKSLEKWYDRETVIGGHLGTSPDLKRRRVTSLTRDPPPLPCQPSPPPPTLERFAPPTLPRYTPPPPRYTPSPPRHLPTSSRYSPPLSGRLSPSRYSRSSPSRYSRSSPSRYGSPPRRSPPRQRRYSPPPPRRSSPPPPRHSSPPRYSPSRYSQSRYSLPPRYSQLTRGHSPPCRHSQLTRGHSPPPRHSQVTRDRSPIPSSSRSKPTPSLVANLSEKLQQILPDLMDLSPELMQLLTKKSTVKSRLAKKSSMKSRLCPRLEQPSVVRSRLRPRLEQPSAAPDCYEDRYAGRYQREDGDRYQDRSQVAASLPCVDLPTANLEVGRLGAKEPHFSFAPQPDSGGLYIGKLTWGEMLNPVNKLRCLDDLKTGLEYTEKTSYVTVHTTTKRPADDRSRNWWKFLESHKRSRQGDVWIFEIQPKSNNEES